MPQFLTSRLREITYLWSQTIGKAAGLFEDKTQRDYLRKKANKTGSKYLRQAFQQMIVKTVNACPPNFEILC